jgi:hypothetical protein
MYAGALCFQCSSTKRKRDKAKTPTMSENVPNPPPRDSGPPVIIWPWRLLTCRQSRKALSANLVGILLGLWAVACATTSAGVMTGLFLYLPILGLEVLVLFPMTIIAVGKESSRVAQGVLIGSMYCSFALVGLAFYLNVNYGASW